MRWILALALATSIVGCKKKDHDSGALDVPDFERLIVEPSGVLLDGKGDTAKLTAVVIDAAGDRTELDPSAVKWVSGDTADVAVDKAGKLTAKAGVGSAQIHAELDGIRSNAAMVMVADLADDAVTFRDNAVIGWEVPAGQTAYDLGFQQIVTLADTAPPAVGDVLVPVETLPIAGRVVAAEKVGKDARITLETVRMNELFDDYAIDERIALNADTIPLAPELYELYEISVNADGRIHLEPRDTGARSPGVQGTTAWGWACTSSVGGPTVTFAGVAMDVDPEMEVVWIDDWQGFKELSLSGSVEAEASLRGSFNGSFTAKTGCTHKLGSIPLGPGAPNAVYGPSAEFGLGVGLSGTASTGTLSWKALAKGKATGEVGVRNIAGNAEMFANGDLTHELDASVSSETFLDDDGMRYTATATAYSYASLKVGPGNVIEASGRLASALGLVPDEDACAAIELITFRPFSVSSGLKAVYDNAPVSVQANSPSFAGTYWFGTFFHAGASLGVNQEAVGTNSTSLLTQFANLVGITFAAVDFVKEEERLVESPHGTWTWPADLVANQPTLVQIDLEDVSILGLNNVDAVVIYKDDGPGGWSEFDRIDRTQDLQQRYIFEWTPTQQEVDDPPQFAAFVEPTLPAIWPLEIKSDSRAPRGVGLAYALGNVGQSFDGSSTLSIISVRADGSDYSVLTGDDIFVDSFVVERDRILFVGTVGVGSNKSLHSMPLAGGATTDLMPGHGYTIYTSDPVTASLDGSAIAIVATGDFVLMDGTGANRLHAVLPDNGPSRYSRYGAWKPDGSLIAYSGSGASGDRCFTLPRGGGNPVQLDPYGTVNVEDCRHPAYSPAGDQVAWYHIDTVPLDHNLVVADANGSNPRTLATYTGSFGGMALVGIHWSEDSQRILTSSFDIDAGNKWLILEADGSSSTEVDFPYIDPALGFGGIVREGTWTPDESRLVFIDPDTGELRSTDIDGTNVIDMTSTGARFSNLVVR